MPSAGMLARHVSKRDMASAMDLIDSALHVGAEPGFRELMGKVCEILPITGVDVGVATISPDGRIVRNARRVCINYPDRWVETYRAKQLNQMDPIAELIFTRERPLIWSQVRRQKASRAHKDFYGLAREFGLVDGFAYGAKFDGGDKGSFFSCIGADLAKHRRHEVLMHYMLPHLHVAVSRMQLGFHASRPELTPREVEVLRWAKFGKTNWEISVLLMVSERTVKFHIENAMRKLNVNNRTQAIAVSLSLGIINWS